MSVKTEIERDCLRRVYVRFQLTTSATAHVVNNKSIIRQMSPPAPSHPLFTLRRLSTDLTTSGRHIVGDAKLEIEAERDLDLQVQWAVVVAMATKTTTTTTHSDVINFPGNDSVSNNTSFGGVEYRKYSTPSPHYYAVPIVGEFNL